jgi:hypothetical protein
MIASWDESMASRLLVKVTEVFRLRDGTVIVPDEIDFPGAKPEETIRVTLRRPDGSEVMKDAVITFPLVQPYRSTGCALTFHSTESLEIPIGTEIWLADSTDELPQT